MTTTMKALRKRRIPGRLWHGASNQWRVILGGRTHYLGRDEAAAQGAYERLLGEWLAGGRPRPVAAPAPLPKTEPEPTAEPSARTIDDVLDAYLAAIVAKNTDPVTGQLKADGNYRKDGEWTSEWEYLNLNLKGAPSADGKRPGGFGALSGDRSVDDLGEHLLLDWREKLEAQTSPVLSRKGINRKVRHVMKALHWAKTKRLISKEAWADCRDLQPLEKGESGTRPGRKRKQAVPTEEVERVARIIESPVEVNGTMLKGNRDIAAMLRVQELLGCRPGEVCKMRWQDIDLDGPVSKKGKQLWLYTVPHAKTEHHEDHEPTAYLIGSRAQNILAQFQNSSSRAGYVWSPRRSMAERGRARKTAQLFRDHWDPTVYREAVKRAQGKDAIRKQTFWTPHEIRHGAITRAYQRHGQAVAQARANHSSSTTTARYIHKDISVAIEAVAAEG